jgi:hypothetical protein
VFLSVVIYPLESCPLPLARVRVRVGYFVGEFTPLNPPLLRGETGILSPLVKQGIFILGGKKEKKSDLLLIKLQKYHYFLSFKIC